MRIISGTHKGRIIKAPKGLPVRPTTDRTKESLFNILHNWVDFDELSVLDLFSGTGNVSLEFLSRGVNRLCAVDRHFRCVKFLKDIIKQWNLGNAKVVKSSVIPFLKHHKQQYGLIFMDPPYDLPEIGTIAQLAYANCLAEDGIMVVEHRSNKRYDHLKGFAFARTYGSGTLSFFSERKDMR